MLMAAKLGGFSRGELVAVAIGAAGYALWHFTRPASAAAPRPAAPVATFTGFARGTAVNTRALSRPVVKRKGGK